MIRSEKFPNDEAPEDEQFPYACHVCLEKATEVTGSMPQIGSLQAVSAEKPLVAAILSVESLIQTIKETDAQIPDPQNQEKLKQWSRTFQNTEFVFYQKPNGLTRYWIAGKLRRNVAIAHAALSRLPSQVAFTICAFKAQQETEKGVVLSSANISSDVDQTLQYTR